MVSTCSKWAKKAAASLTGLGTVAELLPISNRDGEVTSVRDGPKKEYKSQYKPLRRKRRKEVGTVTKVLIEDSMMVRKLPGPAELRIEDGVTNNEEPSFTAWERATKGSLADITKGVVGEVLSVWDTLAGVTPFWGVGISAGIGVDSPVITLLA